MGDGLILVPALKWLAGGVGSSAVVLASVLVYVFMKLKANGKKIEDVSKRCNGQDGALIKHGEKLMEIGTCVSHLEKGQSSLSKKIDRLIEIHLNGGSKK